MPASVIIARYSDGETEETAYYADCPEHGVLDGGRQYDDEPYRAADASREHNIEFHDSVNNYSDQTGGSE